MKLLKRLLLFVLVLIVLAAVASQFLPAHYRVERRTIIKAAPEAVFTEVSTPKLWPTWSAWNTERFPDMQWTFAGPESGVGATSTWDGKSSGQGTSTITQAEPARGITYNLAFDHGTFRSKGEFAFISSPDGVEVVWSDEGELSRNPMHRIFGLFMDKMIGPDFETGLAKLKAKVEAPKP
jgi:uncharacterized protein YndB with AHSA1/START domain